MSSHRSGNSLEKKVNDLLRKYYGQNPESYFIEIPPYTTPTGKIVKYKPDHIIGNLIIESKNALRGGTPQKLVDALIRMQILGDITGRNPILVYQGESYDNYIYNSPVMEKISNTIPDVLIVSLMQFEEFLSTSVKPMEMPMTVEIFNWKNFYKN